LIRRHQAALKQIERWDVARELRPHTPRLAADVLRRDEAVNWDAPVIRAMINQAGPLTGPRTGTHPMAERVEPRPMATRLRPSLIEEPRIPAYRKQVFYGAVNLAVIGAAIGAAIWISR
jgi:hypothetical protein